MAVMGRPIIYDSQFIENEAIAFEEWLQNEDNVFANAFAVERGYDYNLLKKWSDINKNFSRIYARAKQLQELRLLKGGLNGKFKENMCKFVMVNHHNYKEKIEQTVQQDTTISIKTVNYNSPTIDIEPSRSSIEADSVQAISDQSKSISTKD